MLISTLEAPGGEEIDHDDVAAQVGEGGAFRTVEAGQGELRCRLSDQRGVDQAGIASETAGQDHGQDHRHTHDGQTGPAQDLPVTDIHPRPATSRSVWIWACVSAASPGSARRSSNVSIACSGIPGPAPDDSCPHVAGNGRFGVDGQCLVDETGGGLHLAIAGVCHPAETYQRRDRLVAAGVRVFGHDEIVGESRAVVAFVEVALRQSETHPVDLWIVGVGGDYGLHGLVAHIGQVLLVDGCHPGGRGRPIL